VGHSSDRKVKDRPLDRKKKSKKPKLAKGRGGLLFGGIKVTYSGWKRKGHTKRAVRENRSNSSTGRKTNIQKKLSNVGRVGLTPTINVEVVKGKQTEAGTPSTSEKGGERTNSTFRGTRRNKDRLGRVAEMKTGETRPWLVLENLILVAGRLRAKERKEC